MPHLCHVSMSQACRVEIWALWDRNSLGSILILHGPALILRLQARFNFCIVSLSLFSFLLASTYFFYPPYTCTGVSVYDLRRMIVTQ